MTLSRKSWTDFSIIFILDLTLINLMPLISIALIVALYIAWNIGSNDLSNLIGPSVGSESIRLKRAVLMVSLLALAGALMLGDKVIATIGTKIISPAYITQIGAISALAAAGAWVSICTMRRLPVSTTHSIVGAMAGLGIITNVAVHWDILSTIAISWVLSPLLGMAAGFYLYYSIRTLILKNVKSIPERGQIEEKFKVLQTMAAGYVAFALGSNSIANVIGPLGAMLPTVGIAMKIAAAVIMAMGAATLGPRLADRIGNDIVELTPSRGFSAQFAAATVVIGFTSLGIPVSTTQVLITSIIGVGLAVGLNALNTQAINRMLFTWIATPVASAALSMLAYKSVILAALLLL